MQYKSVKGFTPLGQLSILFVFLALGFILAAGVQLIISVQMLPANVSTTDMGDAMLKAMLDPKNVGLARLAQVLGTFFLLFVPAVLYSLVTNGTNKFWLGFNKQINIYQVIIGFFIIFAASVVAAPVGDFTKNLVAHFPDIDRAAIQLEKAYTEQVMILSNLRSWPEFLMAIVIMAFFPALFEEVFFRAGLQQILIRWMGTPIFAIMITSLVFSIIHMSIYLFFSRAILGFVLGMMYHKSKNIWVNVIAHFLNNAIAVAQLFWMSTHNDKVDLTKLDPKIQWWWGVLALIILIFLFWLLNIFSIKNRARIEAKEALLYAKGNTYDPFNQKLA